MSNENFPCRIHILTPLVFMFGLCCTRICPYVGYCAYWNILKKAMDNWTRRTRMIICSTLAYPLAFSMVTVGALSIERCSEEEKYLNITSTQSNSNEIFSNVTADVRDFGKIIWITDHYSLIWKSIEKSMIALVCSLGEMQPKVEN